jgi:putative aldouronate transport system substrate-binding protein
MRRLISVLLVVLAVVMAVPLWATGGSETTTPAAGAGGADLVGARFATTKSITVEIYDRGNAGGSKPEDNVFTNYIKEGMLRDHNVQVTFKPVPRWTEVEVLNNLLAAGDAPDIAVTYSYQTIQTYAGMGGVLDMSPYLKDYKNLLPNLWERLGDQNIYWDRDPVSGSVWAVEALLRHNPRINTFVREDWLKKLNMAAPTSIQQFEAMLQAFKANASTLLGADASKMIPFGLSSDIGWRGDHVITSMVSHNISDKDMYIYGYDDRHLLYPGYKEGVRILNKWYNAGLVWKDFPLYSAGGDPTEDNLIKAGYVGSFMHNYDYPYRGGNDGIHASLKKLIGPDAAFVAIEPFKDDAGVPRKFLSNPIDRKVFFPGTNDEPVASLLYLDWISKLENLLFLQNGKQGVNHTVEPDNSIRMLPATGEWIINSPQNIDYTITINGLELGDPSRTIKSLALGYAGVDKRFMETAYTTARNQARIMAPVNVGAITAQEGVEAALKEKRDTLLVQAVVAKPEQFDAVYDAGMRDYLASGGQAIIDERKAKYEQFYK